MGWIALNVFVPAWEVTSVTRYTGRNERARKVTSGRREGDYRQENWSQAVAESGLPPERLTSNYRISRWFRWGLMCLTGLPAAGFLLTLLAAGGSVSGTGRLRVGCVVLVLVAATGFV